MTTTIDLLALIKRVSKSLEAEGVDPVWSITGYLQSGDPTYIRVHTKGGDIEAKRTLSKYDPDEIIEPILVYVLNNSMSITTDLLDLLKRVSESLEAEETDPVWSITGYLQSGDPTYLRVHTKGGNIEAKRTLSKYDPDEIIQPLLVYVLNN